jgi:hypothetical protein
MESHTYATKKTNQLTEKEQQMNTTATTPKGLTGNEYNALLHAIWRIDQILASPSQLPEKRETLERDRQALHDLFVRLA